MEVRDIRQQAFCWQEKDALRLIQRYKKGKKEALAVYLVLTQIASDRAKENIEEYGIKIMEMSGVGRDSFREVLNRFHDDKIIHLEKGKLKTTKSFTYGPMKISLLTTKSGFQDNSQDNSQDKKSHSIEETLEENLEETEEIKKESSPLNKLKDTIQKKEKKKSSAKRKKETIATLEEFQDQLDIKDLQTRYPYREDIPNKIVECWHYQQGKNGIKNAKATMNNWLKCKNWEVREELKKLDYYKKNPKEQEEENRADYM